MRPNGHFSDASLERLHSLSCLAELVVMHDSGGHYMQHISATTSLCVFAPQLADNWQTYIVMQRCIKHVFFTEGEH